jgi:plasmid stabilization system protein ParE
LSKATDWYLERSDRAASEFVRAVEHALLRIQEAPERYPETRYRRRRFVLMNFPFDIVYRYTTEEIEIVAVAHHSRRPGYWKSR